MLKKIFTELRYTVETKVIDSKGLICNTLWPKHFKHLEMNDNTIRFMNKENRNESTEMFVVTPNRVLYSVENPRTDGYFLENLRKYISRIRKWVDPVKYLRVGIRIYTYDTSINFEDYVAKATTGSIFSNEFLNKFRNDNSIKDFAVTLETSNSRTVFGPMRGNESHAYLDEIIQKDKLLDEFIFYDVDCFAKDVPKHDLVATLSKLFAKARREPSCFPTISEKSI